MIGADLSCLTGMYAARRWRITKGSNILYLPATGWLVMVLIQADPHSHNALKASIGFELTDTDELISYGRTVKRDLRCANGIYDEFLALRIAEPLINVNAAIPYKLLADSSHETELSVMALSHRSTR